MVWTSIPVNSALDEYIDEFRIDTRGLGRNLCSNQTHVWLWFEVAPHADRGAPATEPARTLGKGGKRRFHVLVPVFSCSDSRTRNGRTYSRPHDIILIRDDPFFPGILVFFFLGRRSACVHLVCIR